MVRVYFGDALGRYGFGEGHPFGPDRIHAFWKETVRQGLNDRVEVGQPVVCDEQALRRFHAADYVEQVKRQSLSGSGFLDYGDTPAFSGVFEAASYVVGSDLDGLRAAVSGEQPRIFVPIAGLHHARREMAAGFCVFNDIGVVIETLRAEFGIRRIAYVDPDLIFADIHEDGRFLYPGTGFAEETGTGAAQGTKLNIPLQPMADDADFHRAWGRVEEFVRAGKPEFILLQAGADSIKGDPITHMAFTPAAHGHAARRLCAIADEFADGRIIATGGGGYNRTNLALGWNEVVKAMLA